MADLISSSPSNNVRRNSAFVKHTTRNAGAKSRHRTHSLSTSSYEEVFTLPKTKYTNWHMMRMCRHKSMFSPLHWLHVHCRHKSMYFQLQCLHVPCRQKSIYFPLQCLHVHCRHKSIYFQLPILDNYQGLLHFREVPERNATLKGLVAYHPKPLNS
jgi:hypothetical protein